MTINVVDVAAGVGVEKDKRQCYQLKMVDWGVNAYWDVGRYCWWSFQSELRLFGFVDFD